MMETTAHDRAEWLELVRLRHYYVQPRIRTKFGDRPSPMPALLHGTRYRMNFDKQTSTFNSFKRILKTHLFTTGFS